MIEDNLTVEDYRAMAELRYQLRQFAHFSERAAYSWGLNPEHHQMLLALKGIPEGIQPTINIIAERLQLRRPKAIELTNDLADRGLIRKRPDQADRRRVLLEITDRGEGVLRWLCLIHRSQLKAISDGLIDALHKSVRGQLRFS